MRRTLIGLIAAALMAITMVAPAAAITNNYVDDFDHPFVGLVAFYDDAGEFSHRCSGSLLDDGTPADGSRVFLTAGHCTDGGAPNVVMDSARVWFRQDAGAQFNGTIDPRTGYPDACINDPAFPDAQEQCVTSHEMYNYGFNNFAGFPNTRDAGVVILDSPVILSEYGTVAPSGTLDRIDTRKGNTTLTVSGYGISQAATKKDPATSFRVRLMATSTLTNLKSSWNDGFNVQTNGNGGTRGGTCSGDSGGPVFYPASTNQIVAVTSFGKSAKCNGSDFSYRVDRQQVIDWIDQVSGTHWDL